jgi:hypothetical protein
MFGVCTGNDLQPTVAYLKTLLPDNLIAAKIMKNPVLFHYPLAILRKNVKFLQDKACPLLAGCLESVMLCQRSTPKKHTLHVLGWIVRCRLRDIVHVVRM